MKSKAAVLFEPSQPLEVVDVDVDPPREGEVLVRMAAAGVCHSDLHVMRGELAAPLPAVLGHEGAGTVAEVGAGVTALAPGDHVIPLWRLSCGRCEFCTGGRPALCPAGTHVRNTGLLPDGALLLTGTGIVPPDDFTLEGGDAVSITIDGIGTLRNPVVKAAH